MWDNSCRRCIRYLGEANSAAWSNAADTIQVLCAEITPKELHSTAQGRPLLADYPGFGRIVPFYPNGVALRRVLCSTPSGLAPFFVRNPG
jgi:hypothetical protein